MAAAGSYDSSKAEVFVRIRPENKKEQKYKSKGKEKFLADYTTDSVTIGGRKGKSSTKVFEYPQQVLGPNCSQEEAYVSLGLDELLNKFLFKNQDACVLAYLKYLENEIVTYISLTQSRSTLIKGVAKRMLQVGEIQLQIQD